MTAAPFRFPVPHPVAATVALEPVHNALTSLALLNAADRLPDLDPWVTGAAASLSPQQRHRNRLVFEGLGDALPTDRAWPDFPAYLAGLAAEDAGTLRDRALERIAGSAPDPAWLLTDRAAFLASVARRSPDDPPDEALQSEVHALLNDPLALHALIVGHLRDLWEGALGPEWRRWEPTLQGLTRWLGARDWPPATAAETIRDFLGRDLPPDIAAQLAGVRRVVFVLSPHVGPYASRFGSADTIWVFARARRSDSTNRRALVEDLPLRQGPVKRVELVGPLGALADETRLSILELLARQGELPAQEIIARLGLSQSSISRHLKQLTVTGFLAERRGAGANKHYRLKRGRIDRTFWALTNLLSGKPRPDALPDARAEHSRELRRFLDAEGRVAHWPAKRKDQLLVLDYLAAKFEPGREYHEREVNATLNDWCRARDAANLRRALYDERLMDRASDGSRYRRATDAPAIADTVAAIP